MYNLDHVLLGHQGPIYAMCLDQKYLYTASGDLSVARWDLEANEKDGFTILSKSPAISLETAYSQFLCIGFLNGDLQIIDLLKKEIVFNQNLDPKGVFSLCFNPFAHLMYIGTGNGKVFGFSMKDFSIKIQIALGIGKVRKILFDSVQNEVLAATQDGKIFTLDADTCKHIHSWMAHQEGVNALMILQNNVIVSGGKDGLLKGWHRTSLKETFSFPAHRGVIYDLMEGPNCFVSASRDKSIKVWNQQDLEPMQKMNFHQQSVNALVQQNNQAFVSVSDDKKIGLWTYED